MGWNPPGPHGYNLVSPANDSKKYVLEEALALTAQRAHHCFEVLIATFAMMGGFAAGFHMQTAHAAQSGAITQTRSVARTAERVYEKPIPAYAKWGKIAVAEAKRCHPNAAVVDYLHIGRTLVSDAVAEEAFRLWMREGTKEWGILVRVQFNPRTEELLRVTCQDLR
jgi:Protein of unknown function (DUF3889)